MNLENLTPKHINNIKNHKYSKEGCSILEPILSKYWEWVIKWTPSNISPNILTLTGTIIIISSTLLYIYYSPRMDKSVPIWIHLYAAIALFLYQTLDAIDGKQARRLNCNSSLGELFDHGCDAIVVFLLIINVGCCTRAYYHITCFKICIWFILFGLYLTHWCYYVCGTFHFTSISVTEAQVSIMFLHILAFIFTDKIFNIKVIFDISIFSLISILLWVSNLISIPNVLSIVLTKGKGKHGSSCANTSIISPGIPFTMVFIMWCILEKYSKIRMINNYPVESITCFGLVFASLSTKLLLSTIAVIPFNLCDLTLLNILILCVIVIVGTKTVEIVTLYTVLILMTLTFFIFFARVCLFMSNILNIPVFNLPQKKTKLN